MSLDIEGLSVRYGRLAVLRDVSLHVAAGEVVGLVGESGSGKSTLARSVLRDLPGHATLTCTRLAFEGADLANADAAALRRLRGRRIALVPQDPAAALNPSLPLGEQVAETIFQHRGLAWRPAREAARTLLGVVHLAQPELLMRRFPHQVSGGEKQRVLIAMALAGEPGLLVMDEPTTALDATTAAGILELIRELQRSRGLAVLFITHDLGTVARIARRVAVIYAGSIVEAGPTARVLGAPRHFYTRMLLASLPNPVRTEHRRRLVSFAGVAPDLRDPPGGCIFAARCPAVEPACVAALPVMAAVDGHFSACRRAPLAATATLEDGLEAPSPRAEARRLLLQAERVTVDYRRRRFWRRPDGVPAVRDVSLTLAEGETLGLVGESGSGKSSVARAIMGLVPAEGVITLLGRPVGGGLLRSERREVSRRLQMVFQHPDQSLNPRMRVGRSLARPLRLFGGLSGAALRRGVADWLVRVRLPETAGSRFPHELSGGEKQRVAVARAFAARPSLVICDEITSGLDVSVQATLLNLLTELQARDGTALLLISHDLNMVQHFADRIGVMYRGTLVEMRPVFGLAPPPFHPYTETLLASMNLPEPGLRTRQMSGREAASGVVSKLGCRFAVRCPRRLDARCFDRPPPLRQVTDDHWIRCHIPLADLAKVPPLWECI